jgi:hypothetical protein
MRLARAARCSLALKALSARASSLSMPEANACLIAPDWRAASPESADRRKGQRTDERVKALHRNISESHN